MTIYTRPDTYAEEVPQLEGPVQAAQVGIGGIQGVTKKGPVGVPIRVRSYPAWERIFGGREVRSDTAYEAKAFFDEGGFELITLRQVHFSNIDDKSSYTGGVASRTIQTDGLSPTRAAKTGSIGPYELNPGDSFNLDTDNQGVLTATFTASEATITSTTVFPLPDQNGLTDIFTVNGGTPQTVTYSSGTVSAAQVAADINSQIDGAKASVSGSAVVVKSDVKGTGSSIAVGSGTSGMTWGAPVAGAGNVVDISAVTASEVETIVEASLDALVTVNPGGSFTIYSPLTGPGSELDFQSGSALAPLGLSVEVLNGSATGSPEDTLKLESGYHGVVSPGVEGNNLKSKFIQNPLHSSQGMGSDLAANITALDTTVQLTSLKGLSARSVLKIWDSSNTEYFEVTKVRAEVSGGSVMFFADIDGAFVNSYVIATTQVQSQEFDLEIYNGLTLVETHKSLSMLDTADNYVETIINDENLGSEYVVATDLDASVGLGADIPATDTIPVALTGGTDETIGLVDADWIGSAVGGTGIYGWDSVREFMSFCTPGNNNAAVVHAAATYSLSRMFMEYIGYVDIGMTATDAVAYRENVLGLDSSYVALYAGGMKVFDPLGSGSSPRRNIAGVGAVMGLRGRVDSLPDPTGGPWQAPAGEGAYGTLYSALNVATDYTDNDAGILNSAGINAIRKFGVTSPVLVWGSRTLDSSVQGRFRYINVRRFFQYVEKSVVDSTRWGVHRNNDFRLWSSLKDRVDAWLTALMNRRAFPSNEKATAFFVKMGIDDGTMTQTDVDNGRCIGQIGLAPNKPAEFIIFQFSQLDSGYEITE